MWYQNIRCADHPKAARARSSAAYELLAGPRRAARDPGRGPGEPDHDALPAARGRRRDGRRRRPARAGGRRARGRHHAGPRPDVGRPRVRRAVALALPADPGRLRGRARRSWSGKTLDRARVRLRRIPPSARRRGRDSRCCAVRTPRPKTSAPARVLPAPALVEPGPVSPRCIIAVLWLCGAGWSRLAMPDAPAAVRAALAPAFGAVALTLTTLIIARPRPSPGGNREPRARSPSRWWPAWRRPWSAARAVARGHPLD